MLIIILLGSSPVIGGVCVDHLSTGFISGYLGVRVAHLSTGFISGYRGCLC